jgi:hypothetical protein
MSIFSKLYWKIRREQIKVLYEQLRKEVLKLCFAVVIAESILVGVFYIASNHGIFEYFKPKTIYINNIAYAKENSEKESVLDRDSLQSERESSGDIKKWSAGTFYTYNAEAGQTDENPYKTASGKIVKDGYVANNCLAFGTKIEVEGIGVLEVQDRMNSRYGCNDFDVFRENPKDNFKKSLNYLILK